MQMTIDRVSLMKGLRILKKVINRNPHPAFEAVTFIVKEDEAYMTATDGEVWVAYWPEMLDSVVGEVHISHATLMQVLKGVKEQNIRIKMDDDKVAVQMGATTRLFDNADGLLPPDWVKGKSVKVNELVEAVNATSFAMANETGRYALHGLYLDQNQDGLRVVATDGRIMAMAEVAVDTIIKQTFLLPFKAVAVIGQLSEQEIELTIMKGKDQDFCMIESDVVRMITKGIDGEFPPYLDVIPDKGERTGWAQIVTADLLDLATTGCQLIDNENGVEFTFSKYGLKVKGSKGTSSCSLATPPSDTFSIGMNPKFLQNIAATSRGTTLEISWTSNNRPLRFDYDQDVAVVMPCSIKDAS